MRCGTCGSDNPGGKRFCGDCGTALALACAACGALLAAEKKFCGDCGAPVRIAAIGPSTPPTGLADGERRHLTVLFSDLVGSTEIAARLDPEEWRIIAGRYQRAAAAAAERFGGHVAQYLGDGIVVYFGWPTANEDDAARAVRAGLAIIEAMATLNERHARQRLGGRRRRRGR
jgi:class 3 adenylate cyclase